MAVFTSKHEVLEFKPQHLKKESKKGKKILKNQEGTEEAAGPVEDGESQPHPTRV